MPDLIIESENLKPCSIVTFNGYTFSIPDYQRGYRWTSIEVKKLLEDLEEYFSYELTDSDRPPYYSMQPLIVFKKNDAYEVLDGQQRLTTLFLILKYLGKNNYKLDYDTRKESKNYLENIGENEVVDREHKNDNIDNYHIYNAYYVIKEFLDKDKQSERYSLFSSTILDGRKSYPDLRFIWYDITPEVDLHKEDEGRREKIFSRLNVGKIGLTNAELIKALFINRIEKEIKYHPALEDITKNSRQDLLKDQLTSPLRLRIANEWDIIEHSLHEPDFWSFIYGEDDGKYETRIEFIFDNLVESQINEKEKNKKKEDKSYTFDFFQKSLKTFDEKISKLIIENGNEYYFDAIKQCEEEDHNTIDYVWHKVVNTFYQYQNWFKDRSLYHLIGFLRYLKVPVYEIDAIRNSKNVLTNEDFIKELKKEIVKRTLQYKDKDNKLKDLDISSIQYGSEVVRPILVLFNVLSVMNWDKSEIKFSFNELYNQSYDIEHIHSQHPKTGKRGAEREDWIITVLEYYSGLQSDIHEIPEKKDLAKYRNQKVKEFYNKFTEDMLEELSTQEVCILVEDGGERKITAGYICEELLKIKSTKTPLVDEPIYHLLLDKIFKEQDFDEEQTNNISNLAILDSSTNRGYKNSFFPIKRHWILERENNGYYIPPCTKNVFMKSYSSNFSDLMNWTESDAQSYLEKIEEVLATCRL